MFIVSRLLRPASGYVRVDFKLKNTTKYSGDTVRLRCEITGDPFPHYRWLKNNAPIVERKGKITAKRTNWGSR